MKYRNSVFFVILTIHSFSAQAGFYAFTMHSRANCAGFNESVSWEFNHPHQLQTFSQHVSAKKYRWRCDLVSGWQNTWRSAVYHYAEGYSSREDDWHVEGQHWSLNQWGNPVKLTNTFADDCKFYDGWWDR